MKINVASYIKSERGSSLIMAWFLLSLFGFVAFGLVVRTHRIGAREIVYGKGLSQSYGLNHAAQEWARFHKLQSPHDLANAHRWDPDIPPQTYIVEIDGEKVEVTIEDIPPPE